ncbi:MAG: hypothetical protein ACLFWL_17945 [Candidatus Brocadiia bacterium]
MMVNKKTLVLIIVLVVSIVLNVLLGVKYRSLKRYHDRYFRFVGEVKGICAGNPWPWSDEDADLLSPTRPGAGSSSAYANKWWYVGYPDEGRPTVEIKFGDHHKLIIGGYDTGEIRYTILVGTGREGKGRTEAFGFAWNRDGTVKTPLKKYLRPRGREISSPAEREERGDKIQEASEPDSGNEGDQPKNGTQNAEEQDSEGE